jgi:hypothetical protein
MGQVCIALKKVGDLRVEKQQNDEARENRVDEWGEEMD